MIILTFDIEEWFHLLEYEGSKNPNTWVNFESRIHQNTDLILNLLNEYDRKGTFFCLGWIARKYPEVIRRIAAEGHEIGSHSDMHQLVYESGRVAFKKDLHKSVQSIEDIIGKKVSSFRAPGFSVRESEPWFFEELINAGITCDCSVFPASRTHGGGYSNFKDSPCLVEYNGKQIMEFPIKPRNILGKQLCFSGGGYFRAIPEFVLRNWFRDEPYVITYFHPRDFDPSQPVLPGLSKFRKWKTYTGLGRAAEKLKTILSEFQTMDISEAIEKVDWSSASVVNLQQVPLKDQHTWALQSYLQ